MACREPVAHQIEAHRREEDHHAGQRRRQGRHPERWSEVVQHEAPLGVRRRRAEPEEGEAGGEDHRDADEAGGEHEDRAQHVVQDVIPEEGQRPGAARAGRLDEIERAHLGGDALRDPHHGWDEGHGERQDRVTESGAEDAADRNREQDGWECVEHVHRAHDHAVQDPAGEPGQDAERPASEERQEHGQDSAEEREPAAIHHAGPEIAPDLVGAEPVPGCRSA